MPEEQSELPPQYQGGDKDRVAGLIDKAETAEEVGKIQDDLDTIATRPQQPANWPRERFQALRQRAEQKIETLRSQTEATKTT